MFVEKRLAAPNQKNRNTQKKQKPNGGLFTPLSTRVEDRGPLRMDVPSDPFPSRAVVDLVYEDLYTLTAGSAGTFGTEKIMALNSVYDPDYSGTGHQPYGYDQIAALYAFYKVHGVEMDVTFSDVSADGVCIAAQVQPSNTTLALATYSPGQVLERPCVWTRNLSNTGEQDVTLRQSFRIPTVEGLTQLQFDANLEDYIATVGANPSKIPYLRFALAALDASSTPTCRVLCRMRYRVEFFGRTMLSQS